MSEEYSNMVNGILYHPKGSMCEACKYNHLDCSDLLFSTMQTLEVYSKGDLEIHKVKCTEFIREAKNNE